MTSAVRARHVFLAFVPLAVLAPPLACAAAGIFTPDIRTLGDAFRTAGTCFLVELMAAIVAAVAVEHFRARRTEPGGRASLAVARMSSLLSLLLLVAWSGWLLYSFMGSLAQSV